MRRSLAALVVLIFAGVCGDGAVGEESIAITIDQIKADDTITGSIRGLARKATETRKVIVYVYTDQWYIHPYAGQGEGLSWAAIEKNGSWRLKTVQREHRADMIAALLVRRSYPEPNRLLDLQGIPYEAIVIKKLIGSSDFGKL